MGDVQDERFNCEPRESFEVPPCYRRTEVLPLFTWSGRHYHVSFPIIVVLFLRRNEVDSSTAMHCRHYAGSKSMDGDALGKKLMKKLVQWWRAYNGQKRMAAKLETVTIRPEALTQETDIPAEEEIIWMLSVLYGNLCPSGFAQVRCAMFPGPSSVLLSIYTIMV